MEDSILKTIRKMILGIPINSQSETEGASFDTDLIIHINTALAELTQLGVGPDGGFFITDESSKWSDFLGASPKEECHEMAKTYVYLKTRLLFDPPQNSSAVEQMTKSKDECGWRLCEAYEHTGKEQS